MASEGQTVTSTLSLPRVLLWSVVVVVEILVVISMMLTMVTGILTLVRSPDARYAPKAPKDIRLGRGCRGLRDCFRGIARSATSAERRCGQVALRVSSEPEDKGHWRW